jgi:AsmA protein
MKRALVAVGILVALLLVAVVAISFLVDANQFRPRLESELTTALGRPVKLGDLSLRIWSGSVSASDISIADDPAFSKQPFLSAKSIKIVVELQPLIFSRKLNVTGIEIDGPEIALIQSRNGAWNFSSLGNHAEPKQKEQSASETLDLSAKLVRITNGRISLLRGGDPQPKILENMTLEVRDFAPSSAFPLSLTATVKGGGDLKLTGKAGPIDVKDASDTPFEANLSLAKLDVVKSSFVRESTGFSGLLSMTGTVESTKESITFSGVVSAEQLRLAERGTPAKKTVTLNIDLKHDPRKRSGVLRRGDIQIGKAKAALTGTYAIGEQNTELKLKFSAPAMEIDELEAMLPSLAIVLPQGSSLRGGTAVADFAIEGTADKLVTAGSVGLKNTRLVGFDLGSRIMAIAQIAGIKVGPDTDFQNIGADLKMSPAGTEVKNIAVNAPAIGDLIGGGTISTANALDFKMTAHVKSSNVINVVTSNVPFFIQGTSSEPKFVPDVKGMATSAATNAVKGIASGEITTDKLKNMTPEDAVGTATGIMNLFNKKKTNPPASK